MEKTEVTRILRLLTEARDRSDNTLKGEPMQVEGPDLQLVADLVDAGYIRGDVKRGLGGSLGVAMGGISISGREYMSRLEEERNARGIYAKVKVWGMAALAFVFGSLIAPLVQEFLKKQFFP